MMELSKRHAEIRRLIKERSPFDEKETNRILNEWFGSVPTLVKIVIQDYQFDKKKVLDVGCAYGNSHLYWREDSEGVEVQEKMVKFLRALGRIVYKLDVENGFPGLKQENYDAIYCAALIEHLRSPYSFLVRLRPLLRTNGILAISYPVVPLPLFRNLWELIVGFRGWMAREHLYFFTPETSKLMLERAGFKVVKQYSPAFYRIPFFRKINKVFLPIGMSCLSICQKNERFNSYSF